MKTYLIDRSNYFKSLLILIGIDGKLTSEEKELITQIGEYIGFDKKFINKVINELFINEHINLIPFKFSNQKIAQCLVKDGLKFASSDGDICLNELKWLKSICKINELTENWFDKELHNYQLNHNSAFQPSNLEICNIPEFNKFFR